MAPAKLKLKQLNDNPYVESKGFELSGNGIYNEDANTIKYPRYK